MSLISYNANTVVTPAAGRAAPMAAPLPIVMPAPVRPGVWSPSRAPTGSLVPRRRGSATRTGLVQPVARRSLLDPWKEMRRTHHARYGTLVVRQESPDRIRARELALAQQRTPPGVTENEMLGGAAAIGAQGGEADEGSMQSWALLIAVGLVAWALFRAG